MCTQCLASSHLRPSDTGRILTSSQALLSATCINVHPSQLKLLFRRGRWRHAHAAYDLPLFVLHYPKCSSEMFLDACFPSVRVFKLSSKLISHVRRAALYQLLVMLRLADRDQALVLGQQSNHSVEVSCRFYFSDTNEMPALPFPPFVTLMRLSGSHAISFPSIDFVGGGGGVWETRRKGGTSLIQSSPTLPSLPPPLSLPR